MLNVIRNWFDRYFSNEEAVLLFIVLTLATIIVLSMGRMLAPFFIAVIFAFLLQGLVVRAMAYRLPHLAAVIVVYLVFISILLTLLLIVLPLVWQQLKTFIQEFPNMMSQGQALLLLLPEQYPEIISERLVLDWIAMLQAEIGGAGPQWLVSISLASIPNLIAIIIYLILVPIIVFFLLKDRKLILQWVTSFLPRKRPLMTQISEEMNTQLAGYIRGKALEIFLVGAVTYIAFVILGLNYAALLAVVIGLSVVIPYIGAVVVTIPVALIAYFQWGWSSEAFYVLLVHLIIQGLDGNVLVPLLFSEAVNLHPVAIILSILVFGGLWGLWGVFFAIPLATLVKAVISAWPYQGKEQEKALEAGAIDKI